MDTFYGKVQWQLWGLLDWLDMLIALQVAAYLRRTAGTYTQEEARQHLTDAALSPRISRGGARQIISQDPATVEVG